MVGFSLSAQVTGDLRNTLPRLRKLGFAGITLPTAIVDGLSASGLREVRSIAGRHELRLHALRWDVPGRTLLPPGDVDRVVDGLRRAMETARQLVVPIVLTDLGPLPPAGPAPAPRSGLDAGDLLLPSADEIAAFGGGAAEDVKRDPAHEQVVDAALHEVGTWTDRMGVAIALGSTLAGSASLARTLTAARAPLLGLDLDPAALLPEDASALLSDHGDRLLHVRARDATLGEAGRTRPAALGAGDVEWSGLLAALTDADFAGPLTVERDTAKGVAFLREQVAL